MDEVTEHGPESEEPGGIHGSALPAGGSPSYGPPPYGAHPFGGQPPFGQPPYGPPPYGVHGWSWPAPAPQRRAPGRALVALAVAAGVFAVAAAGGVVGHVVWGSPSTSNSGIGISPSIVPGGTSGPASGSTAAGGPQDAASIARNVDPGLVDVNTEISALGVEGAGTGMVLTSTGEVLTNNHVVEGANKISVTDVGTGKTYNATVVGYDRSHDVAVLQLVGASGLQTVKVGNSSAVNVGEGVVALGNAGGTGGTPSYAGGTVTALGQSITASDEADGSSEQLTGLIETNAGIVSGDSGGPLVDTAGKVVAMDTAASAGYQFQNSGNQGFAIPINEAVSIARQIEAGSASSTIHVGPTAFLGVAVQSPGASQGGFGGGGGTTTSGAEIVDVVSGGPASQSQLAAGDVITAVGSNAVASAQDLTTVMLAQKPGATVTIDYFDPSGQAQTTSVTLGSGPAQ